MRRAVFPGSFDPITLGHEDVVRRAAMLFDEIVIGVGVNTSKKYRFSTAQRVEMLEKVFTDLTNVRVQSFEGLTAAFCKNVDAKWMLRGVRNVADFEYESTIAQMTKSLDSSLETTILFTSPQYAHISSTVVREIMANDGDVSAFVPALVLSYA